MSETRLTLDEAVELTRTGDIWLFRGRSAADQAIRAVTNSPVNHVGMAVALDDLPPLMWHAELGRSLPDAWTGSHHRGVQLHDLRAAVTVWCTRYGQRAWLRQLETQADDSLAPPRTPATASLPPSPAPSMAPVRPQGPSPMGQAPSPMRGFLIDEDDN